MKSLEQLTQELLGQMQWLILTQKHKIEQLEAEILKLKSLENNK